MKLRAVFFAAVAGGASAALAQPSDPAVEVRPDARELVVPPEQPTSLPRPNSSELRPAPGAPLSITPDRPSIATPSPTPSAPPSPGYTGISNPGTGLSSANGSSLGASSMPRGSTSGNAPSTSIGGMSYGYSSPSRAR